MVRVKAVARRKESVHIKSTLVVSLVVILFDSGRTVVLDKLERDENQNRFKCPQNKQPLNSGKMFIKLWNIQYVRIMCPYYGGGTFNTSKIKISVLGQTISFIYNN